VPLVLGVVLKLPIADAADLLSQRRPGIGVKASKSISNHRLNVLHVHNWHEEEVPPQERPVAGKDVLEPVGCADSDVECLASMPPQAAGRSR
jgi:hypothetical protein